MISSKMRVARTSGELPFVLVLLVAVGIYSISCEQAQPASGFKESATNNDDEQLVLGVNRADGMAGPLRANSRLLAVPLSLARFMFPHSRPGEHQSQAALMATSGFASGSSNNKRSSSQLDALTGVTGLGKRSVPVEYINLEPIFGRQNLVRAPARVQDMRWAPLEPIDGPLMVGDY